MLLFQGWDGVVTGGVTEGSAEGGRVLTIDGFGYCLALNPQLSCTSPCMLSCRTFEYFRLGGLPFRFAVRECAWCVCCEKDASLQLDRVP